MKRGRPIKSKIRENIVEILYFLGEGYAYQIHKIYIEIFPAVTSRSIYYHLKKGTDLDEFKIKQIKQESGNYSWGDKAEKIYYALGPLAKPKINSAVKKYFDKKRV
jgi:hypothetical protein